MSKVVSLTEEPAGKREVSEVCVDTLRDLLQRAEAGEVVGVGLAVLHHDGDASYHVAGRIGGFSMSGALACVQAEICDINRGMIE